VDVADPLTGSCVAPEVSELDVRVAEQQAAQLDSTISGCPKNADLHLVLSSYT